MKPVIATLALMAWPMLASAHETAKGPNGGRVMDAAGYHIEMVASGTELTLFLTEFDAKPLASDSLRNARAIVQDSGKTTSVPLQSAAPNKLVGILPQAPGPGARVVVSAVLVNGRTISARFAAD